MSYSVWTLRSPWGCHHEAAAILPLRQCRGCSWWRQQKNNHIWRVLRGWFPGDLLDVCGTEFWVVGSDRRVYGSLGWVPGRLVTTVLCVSKQSTWKLPFAKLSKWKLTIKELGNVGQLREVAVTTEKREEEVEEEEWGEKNVEKQKGKEEQGEEGKEETDDTGSLSQTVSDSLACSIPRRLSCNPRCENLEGGRGGGRRLVEEGKPHGKSPVQGLSLWKITTLKRRNKQTKQKIMRYVLRIVFKVQWTLFPRGL